MGEAHHHVRGPLEGVREQRLPFASMLAVFWVCPWSPCCLIASQFWAERRDWGRACCKRFCKRQADLDIDLTLEDVEDARTRSDRFQLRVAGASEEAIGLKLLKRMEPFP